GFPVERSDSGLLLAIVYGLWSNQSGSSFLARRRRVLAKRTDCRLDASELVLVPLLASRSLCCTTVAGADFCLFCVRLHRTSVFSIVHDASGIHALGSLVCRSLGCCLCADLVGLATDLLHTANGSSLMGTGLLPG